MTGLGVPNTLVDAQAALRSRRWSVEGLTDWCLTRAAELAPFNGFLDIERDLAMRSAERVGVALRAALVETPPQPVPGLTGIPLAHKDLFYRPDRAPGCASRVIPPPHPGLEATVLSRLRLAGAIDLGPLNLSEMAYGPTGHNAFTGAARNPWNADHATGGSSSGSAVAVAGGAAFGSLGSDSGGSIRTPASWCGLSALKPSRGGLSLAGTMPLAPDLDSIGLMARSARDLVELYTCLSGPDKADPRTLGARAWDADGYARAQLAPVRLAIVDEWFHEQLSLDVAAGLDRARSVWATALGARVVSAQWPDLGLLVRYAGLVMAWQAWHTHAPLFERQDGLYTPNVRARLLRGADIADAEYREAHDAIPRHAQTALDRVFRHADVLLLPCNPTAAPRLDASDVGASPAMMVQVDAITRCLRPFNYLGFPALVLPCGISTDGLPFGFQLVGRPGEEARLLALGVRWQGVTDWHRLHPPGLEM